MPSYTTQHLAETAEIVQKLDPETLENMVDLLADVRNRGGRLFFLGVGGSAANASHAVNDFRKITGIESYAPTDNVAELTARTNDEGWASVFVEWLKGSRLHIERCAHGIFGRGRKSREKCQSEPGVSAAIRQRSWCIDSGNRGSRWRIHRQSSRCMLHRSDCESAERHASFRGISGCDLAPARFASETESPTDQMGKYTVGRETRL